MVFIFVHSAMPGHVSGGESRLFAQILMAVTGMSAETASFAVRKMAHFTEFAVLGACLAVNMYDCRLRGSAGRGSSDEPAGTPAEKLHVAPEVAAWVLGTAYAATDEFHQLFVEGRSGQIRDVCIDAAGVACGVLIMLLHSLRRRSASGKRMI